MRKLHGIVATTCLVIAASLLGAVRGQNTGDPRCAVETCTTTKPPGLADFVVDPTTCANTTCPRCLTGSVWQQRLADLNLGKAPRTIRPHLVYENWLSSNILGTIFRILSEEALDVPIRPAVQRYDGYQVLCCDEMLLSLEMWPTRRRPEDDGFFSLQELPNGFEGASGLFVGRHTLAQFPLVTAYNSFEHIASYQHIFPKAFSTPCTDLLVDPALGCVAGNYVCDANLWTNTTCTQGRYVPPQCQGALASTCQELILADPTWDAGFFEGIIRNLNMKFVAAYVGAGNLPGYVRRKVSAGEHILFYWWKPDPVVASVGGQAMNFPPSNVGCIKKQNTDPTLSGGDCGYVQGKLAKMGRRRDLNMDTDFKFFFESFQISGPEMDDMLASHTESQGTENAYDVACGWAQNNFATWKDWIRNTEPVIPPVPAKPALTAGSLDTPGKFVGVAIVLPIATVTVIVVVGLAYRHHMSTKRNKMAPRCAPLCLLFTDVETSTKLWEAFGPDMGIAIDLHHELVREAIEENGAYEIKTIGDAFMIAVTSIVDATMLAVSIQRKLMEAPWPDALLGWEGKEGSGPRDVWRGLRVRIGVHLCVEVQPQFDKVHAYYDYYGPDVNMSARVESQARGGQILMSSGTYEALVTDPDYEAIVHDEIVAIKFASGVELKGVATTTTLFSITPAELAERTFIPIEGATDETKNLGRTLSLSGGERSMASSMASMSIAGGGGANNSKFLNMTLAELSKDRRTGVLDELCKAVGVSTTLPYNRRVHQVAEAVTHRAGKKRKPVTQPHPPSMRYAPGAVQLPVVESLSATMETSVRSIPPPSEEE